VALVISEPVIAIALMATEQTDLYNWIANIARLHEVWKCVGSSEERKRNEREEESHLCGC
jgi:hypothetical protein